jgi:hypothetical protein
MNDFTKEELKHIKDMLFGIKTNFDYEDDVINKIQSMIDNYCEHECNHEWIKCLYGENRIPINICALCNLREKR